MFIHLIHSTTPISAQTPTPPLMNSIRAIHWHPNGTDLARTFENGLVEVVDTSITPETVIFSYSNGTSPASSISWSESGNFLAVGIGNDVHVWDFADNNRHTVLSGHVRPVVSLSWSYDELRIVSVSANGFDNIRIWDVVNEEQLLAFGLLDTFVADWRHNVDDNFIVAGVSGSLLRLNPVTGDITGLNTDETAFVGAGITALMWNNQNSLVATADVLGAVSIFDNNGILYTFLEPTNPVRINTVAWNSDGQFIASGDDLGTIRVWSVNTGQEVDVIDTGEDAVFSVSWNSVSNEIAYGGISGVMERFQPNLPVLDNHP